MQVVPHTSQTTQRGSDGQLVGVVGNGLTEPLIPEMVLMAWEAAALSRPL